MILYSAECGSCAGLSRQRKVVPGLGSRMEPRDAVHAAPTRRGDATWARDVLLAMAGIDAHACSVRVWAARWLSQQFSPNGGTADPWLSGSPCVVCLGLDRGEVHVSTFSFRDASPRQGWPRCGRLAHRRHYDNCVRIGPRTTLLGLEAAPAWADTTATTRVLQYPLYGSERLLGVCSGFDATPSRGSSAHMTPSTRCVAVLPDRLVEQSFVPSSRRN